MKERYPDYQSPTLAEAKRRHEKYQSKLRLNKSLAEGTFYLSLPVIVSSFFYFMRQISENQNVIKGIAPIVVASLISRIALSSETYLIDERYNDEARYERIIEERERGPF